MDNETIFETYTGDVVAECGEVWLDGESLGLTIEDES